MYKSIAYCLFQLYVTIIKPKWANFCALWAGVCVCVFAIIKSQPSARTDGLFFVDSFQKVIQSPHRTYTFALFGISVSSFLFAQIASLPFFFRFVWLQYESGCFHLFEVPGTVGKCGGICDSFVWSSSQSSSLLTISLHLFVCVFKCHWWMLYIFTFQSA